MNSVSKSTKVWSCLSILAFVVLPHVLPYDYFSSKYPFQHLSSSKTDIITFKDNRSSSFQALHIDEINEFLYIGGENYLFRVPLNDISDIAEERTLNISSEPADLNLCENLLGYSKDECQNYLRVVLHDEDSPEKLLVCGTSAWNPKCYKYTVLDIAPPPINESEIEYSDGLIFQREGEPTDGRYKCPFGKEQNTNSLLADGVLYTATIGHRSGTDVLIYRAADEERGIKTLRTEMHDLLWLNEPTFVQSFEIGNEIYVFFREVAIEATNCEKMVYSRVARVCKNDEGGARFLEDEWTTYLKTRLNCSVPGEFPFYFNEIQDAFMVQEDNTTLIYAIFTNPSNSNTMSAVCVYDMATIKDIFENGAFKDQADPKSWWLPIESTLDPRPGDCGNPEVMKEADDTLLFIDKHPLMDEAAKPIHGSPVLSTSRDRFVKIAVEQIGAIDVLYIATDKGTILKAVYYLHENEGVESYIIQETVITEAEPHNSILSMKIPKNNPKYLYVGTDDTVVQLPLAQCSHFTDCSLCIAARDPHCQWESSDGSTNDECTERQEPIEISDLINMDSRCSECSKTKKTISLGKPIGQPVVLPCSLIEANWTKDGGSLNITDTLKYTPVVGVGMVIGSVEASDSGLYGCQSACQLTQVELTVQDVEAYSLQFAEPYLQQQETSACAGAHVYLYCRAVGGLNLQFKWAKDGQDLVDGAYQYMGATLARVDGCDYDKSSWLEIILTDESAGEYTCRVNSDDNAEILSDPAKINMATGTSCITDEKIIKQATQWETEYALWITKKNTYEIDTANACSIDVKDCTSCLNLKATGPTD